MNIKSFSKFSWVVLLFAMLLHCASSNAQLAQKAVSPIKLNPSQSATTFYENTMNTLPFLPSNTTPSIDFKLPLLSEHQTALYRTSTQADYEQYGWEKRLSRNWSFFNINKEQGKVLIIDIKQKNGIPAYRYLANANSQITLYEPWSSSKVFAYSAAIAKLRQRYDTKNITALGFFGRHNIADLVTSMHTYHAFGLADGNSNAIATFFANLAGRDFLSALYYDQWLKLSTPNLFFRGAYGPTAFEPAPYEWRSLDNLTTQHLTMNKLANQDPGYRTYRCEECGLTGNKPTTTLAQAEWLKRLAMHVLDSSTAHPYLHDSDIETLLYGRGHSQKSQPFAGMSLGISTMLQDAIANNLRPHLKPQQASFTSKQILDDVTQGNWRVFQKIGWGPSETRSTTENVVLAFVHLPSTHSTVQARSFVLAAQVSVPEAKEQNVAHAGLKMQTLLDLAIQQYMQLN